MVSALLIFVLGFPVDHPLPSLWERAAYYGRNKFHPLFQACAWCLLVVRFFERPPWTYEASNWNDPNVYPMSGITYMELEYSASIVFICAICLSLSIYLEWQYEKSILRRRFLYAFIFCVGLLIFETMFGFFIILSGRNRKKSFSTSPLEIFAILFIEQRYVFKIIDVCKIFPAYLIMLFVLTLYIGWCTTLAFLLFPDNSEEHKWYFNNYGGGMYNMLMMLNSSNWPTPIIPAINVCTFNIDILNLIIFFLNRRIATALFSFSFFLS